VTAGKDNSWLESPGVKIPPVTRSAGSGTTCPASRTGGGGASLNRGTPYDDVRDAWHHYLEHDNQGRGVVLVGHSQGSFILAELIRQEIDKFVTKADTGR